ncbi:MAG: DNA polymerase I [Prevotella sp.]|nr:DNA polymerase I [Bacteroides sp.]MCM1365758.1 DNA polymerase I [Prevotella sp.]MCM1436428.1 DNA polymerase I [Prevotella sp.]
MEEKRLFLLDAYALIFRAYYALIKMPRQTRDGFNTSAIFGFVNTLEELLRSENPTHIAVCFDPPGPTFRHEEYEQYKGEREATPEDIKLSIPVIKEIIKAYRIPIIEEAGYEADDVIGTMAHKAAEEGFTVYMMTPDKDFGQLVSPNVLQYKPSYRGRDFELRGEKEVCERYGIQNTRQVIDLLALMGDKIDNIPGCPGVGEKTAVKLIDEYGSVENLIANTASLKGALKKKVEENAEQILFSKHLATICTDVPLEVSPNDLVKHQPDVDKLFAIFKEMEFRTLTERVKKRLAGEKSGQSDSPSQPSLFDSLDSEQMSAATDCSEISNVDCTVVTTSDQVEEMVKVLLTEKDCGVMMLAEGGDDVSAVYIGTAVASRKKGWYLPAVCKEGTAALLDIFARRDIRKICVDAKKVFVQSAILREDGLDPFTNYYDIPLAHYLLQPEHRHDIGDLTSTYLGCTLPPSPPEADSKRKSASLKQLSDKDAGRYACTMANAALRLLEPLEKQLEAENLLELLKDIELPLIRVLAEMELAGVRIDVDALNAAANAMSEKLSGIENQIFTLTGMEFNISSPAKVGEVLFDRLGLEPKPKKTKTGQYSTSEEVLEKVSGKHPVVSLILEYRKLKKLLTTYLTALPATINPATGKIHTLYNQTVTATGRISSSNPNLQNIPVRDDVGREIRRAFIPDKGHLFLSADYSQIELRLVADFAHDETMLDAFKHDKDIHAITAAKIYHKSLEDVTSSERRAAKTANFGILYGISAFGLSTRLGVSRSEAKGLIDNYFATFPTVHQYMNASVEKAREQGYVVTRMGRKRRLPDINSKNPVVRGYAERNAINAPIQGSAADIIKKAMVDISHEMHRRGLKSKMIMQVHDELNFDVVPEELSDMQELVTTLMEKAYTGDVRLTASCGVADNWLDAH